MKSLRTIRPFSLVGLITFALLALVVTPAHAEYNDSARHTWSPSSTVYAIAVAGDRVYIGGRFTFLRNVDTGKTQSHQRIAAFSATTGDLISSFNPRVNDEVRSIAVSADGQTIYFGGRFSSVNGQPRQNVAAVDRNGNLISNFNVATNSRVKDIVRVGGDLYLGGTFGKVNGVTRPGLAKVSASNGQLSSWKVVTKVGRPRALVPSTDGQDLIVAGSFTSLNGQPRNFLGSVSLNTGTVTSWHPNSVCSICNLFDVATDNSGVYVAVGGKPGGRALKYSEHSSAPLWQVQGDGNAQAIDVYGNTVYVGGHFGPSFGHQHRTNLAAVNATTGSLLPFAPNLGTNYFPGVWAIDAGPSFLRVGGGFRSVDGVAQARYAEFPNG